MITLNTKVKIDKSHILTINLPNTIQSGEYDALLVLDKNNKKQEPIWFPNYSFNIESRNTFRREDMYGENGR